MEFHVISGHSTGHKHCLPPLAPVGPWTQTRPLEAAWTVDINTDLSSSIPLAQSWPQK